MVYNYTKPNQTKIAKKVTKISTTTKKSKKNTLKLPLNKNLKLISKQIYKRKSSQYKRKKTKIFKLNNVAASLFNNDNLILSNINQVRWIDNKEGKGRR